MQWVLSISDIFSDALSILRKMLGVCQEHIGFSRSIWWWSRISSWEKILPSCLPGTHIIVLYFSFVVDFLFCPLFVFSSMNFTPGCRKKSVSSALSSGHLCFESLVGGGGLLFGKCLAGSLLRCELWSSLCFDDTQSVPSPGSGLCGVISFWLTSPCFYLGPDWQEGPWLFPSLHWGEKTSISFQEDDN